MGTRNKKETKTSDDVTPSPDSIKEKKIEKRQFKDVFEIEDDIFKPTKNYQPKKKAKVTKVNPDIANQQTIKKKIDSDNEADDISNLMAQYRQTKQYKVKVCDTEHAEVRKKVMGLFNEQHKTRKQLADNLFTNWSEIINHIETDYDVMKENQQKLEQLMVSSMKSVEHATTVFKENVKSFSKIHSIKKQFDEMESHQIQEQESLMYELDNDIMKLQEKMEKETKRQAYEHMCRRISNAMRNN